MGIICTDWFPYHRTRVGTNLNWSRSPGWTPQALDCDGFDIATLVPIAIRRKHVLFSLCTFSTFSAGKGGNNIRMFDVWWLGVGKLIRNSVFFENCIFSTSCHSASQMLVIILDLNCGWPKTLEMKFTTHTLTTDNNAISLLVFNCDGTWLVVCLLTGKYFDAWRYVFSCTCLTSATYSRDAVWGHSCSLSSWGWSWTLPAIARLPHTSSFAFCFCFFRNTCQSHWYHRVYPTNASRCMNLLILLKLVMIHDCCSYNLFWFCLQLLHFNLLLAMIFSLPGFSPVPDGVSPMISHPVWLFPPKLELLQAPTIP